LVVEQTARTPSGVVVAAADLRLAAPDREGGRGDETWPRPRPDRRRAQAVIAMNERRYRAGDSIEDVCRACKLDRMHTVVVTDQDGRPLRVSCGFCGSEHNYRGGPAVAVRAARATAAAPQPRAGAAAARGEGGHPFPIVSDRERTVPQMSGDRLGDDVELLLRRIIREE